MIPFWWGLVTSGSVIVFATLWSLAVWLRLRYERKKWQEQYKQLNLKYRRLCGGNDDECEAREWG